MASVHALEVTDSAGERVIAAAPARLRQELYEITLELDKRYRLNIERLGP
jgi:hypothetical protein